MYKKFIHTFLVILCLSGMDPALGQSFLNVDGSSRVTIAGHTSVGSINLFISGESRLINRGELTVWGVLGNSAGPSGLLIKADENGYGSLLHYSSGVYASVEQFLESERWHLVSPAVTSSTIATYMNIYLKEWNEPDAEWNYLSTPVTIPMNMARGYSAWASDALTGSTTVTYAGPLVSSNMAVSGITYTPESSQTGYFLAGNPYPCALEWNENWILNDVGGWAVVYDNGVFKGWNPYMPEGERSYNNKTDGYIAPAQGFWIRALGPDPFVMIPQSARAHKPDLFLKDDKLSVVQNLHLTASANGYEDEATVLFMKDGTTGFDGLYELEKHNNVTEAPTLYSIPANGNPLAVQVLPEEWIHQTDNPVIPLGFEFGLSMDCEISATGLESFETGQKIYLEDLGENLMHDFFTGPYAFSSTPLNEPGRFLLHFGAVNSTEEQKVDHISIYSHLKSVYIRLPAEQKGYARVFDLSGRLITGFPLSGQVTGKTLPQTGYYIVTVVSEGMTENKKVFITN